MTCRSSRPGPSRSSGASGSGLTHAGSRSTPLRHRVCRGHGLDSHRRGQPAPLHGALYVVNYHSDTVSKLRTSDLRVLQVVRTNRHPIGIAYDVHGGAGHVWVACYTGSIMVFKDS